MGKTVKYLIKAVILTAAMAFVAVTATRYFGVFPGTEENAEVLDELDERVSSAVGFFDTGSCAGKETEGTVTAEYPEGFSITQVAPWDGQTAYICVNGNIPYFTEGEKGLTECFEEFTELDPLGRAGTAFALLSVEMMPEEERDSDLSAVTPSGWEQAFYPGLVENDALYNRCHLIAYCLTGHNAEEERNFVTGTRYMNTEGMLPFELEVRDYLYDYGGNALYRVTPVFYGNDLNCTGVLMEGWTADGKVCFCVFCYNEQPGIEIDHATGESSPGYEFAEAA